MGKYKTNPAPHPHFATDIVAAELDHARKVRTLIVRLNEEEEIAQSDFTIAIRATNRFAELQTELADFIPTNPTNLSRWVKGISSPPRYSLKIVLKRCVEFIDSKCPGLEIR